MDPPGCIIALTPALAKSSIESLKGKKPSEAKTLPATLSPALLMAFSTAHTLLTSLVLFLWWPYP